MTLEQRMSDTAKETGTPSIHQSLVDHAASMRVQKRSGEFEPVDVVRITEKVTRCGDGISHINPYLIASKAISGIYDGVTTAELDNHLIHTAAMMIGEEPEYSKLAARLLADYISKEVVLQEINCFTDSIRHGHAAGLIAQGVFDLVTENSEIFNQAIDLERNKNFEYFGLRTVYDRYLLKDPKTRIIMENPQYFFLRVAAGLARDPSEAVEFYKLISSFEYMPSTPTLFNSGTCHPQMSSCYLLDSPQDSLEAIYGRYTDVALLSKFAGGIGLGFSRIRSRGSLIKGTNGRSNGIVPFLKTLDSSVSAVNQGGKRKGAACVYVETWHQDIQEFLMLRDNTGDEALRTHNLNLANWIPDLFMKRVQADEIWSLFDPSETPYLVDLYGDAFEQAYLQAEQDESLNKKQLPARELYGLMMKTLAQTGNGWMTFKDASNNKGNQTLKRENVIHLSNLCTEILEVTSADETAVCNLGSLNLSRYIKDDRTGFDFELLAKNIKTAVKYLDRVIDINFYPIDDAKSSNSRWRPIGLGVMGLQNVFFKLSIPFDSEKARALSCQIQEEIYYHALKASADLAEANGPHTDFAATRASQGQLQFDLWGIAPKDQKRWNLLKERIQKVGLRNSLTIAIAPTATIASITGAYECIEPQISNLFKRETLSGEFLQINPYLVTDLRRLNLWDKEMKDAIKLSDGSIQGIDRIPSKYKEIYRTVWEVPQRSLIDMAADRGAYIDQSQSLNLFIESPTIGKMSSMYLYAWQKGLKTTYYSRSRGATRINKTTLGNKAPTSSAEAIACSLENPESCESCS